MTVREVAEALGVDPGCVLGARVPLDTGLFLNRHSWAGTQGRVAYVVGDGGLVALDRGGWVSDNGRLTEDLPDVSLAVALQRVDVATGAQVVVHTWDYVDRRADWPERAWTFRLTAGDVAFIASVVDPARADV